jgi:hypothetical protein
MTLLRALTNVDVPVGVLFTNLLACVLLELLQKAPPQVWIGFLILIKDVESLYEERFKHRHSGRAGIIEAMSNSSSRRFPVTTTRLPVTRCQICHRTVAYRPGSLSAVLTEHYRRDHPEALGIPSG